MFPDFYMEVMNKKIWMVGGFFAFLAGILSLILSLVGLEWTPLSFIYGKGVFTIIIQILLLFGGIVMMYIARLDTEAEE
jgi:hypothetical protein